MSDRAPGGQPTESIELMLSHAKSEWLEWSRVADEAEKRMDRANEMMRYWDDQEAMFSAWLYNRKQEEAKDV